MVFFDFQHGTRKQKQKKLRVTKRGATSKAPSTTREDDEIQENPPPPP